MRVFLTSVAALTIALSPSIAHAFCRATTNQDFTPTAAEPCDLTGVPLAWPGKCVGYSLQSDASLAQGIDFATATEVAHKAFGEWSAHTCFTMSDASTCTTTDTGKPPSMSGTDLGSVTCGNVESNDDAGNANIVVFRDANWPYPDADVTYALTTVQFFATGEIVGADMEINSDPKWNHFTTSDTAVSADLQSIMTHEAGHFYGLAHTQPSNGTATMNAEYVSGEISLRSLAPDDICAICAAYPPDRVATCDPTPRNGFAKLCGGVDNPLPGKSSCSCETPVGASSQSIAIPLGFAVCFAIGIGARRRRKA